MEIKKLGLIHDGFLVDISRKVQRIPFDLNAGFFLEFQFNHYISYYCQDRNGVYTEPQMDYAPKDVDLSLWVPNIRSVMVLGDIIVLKGFFVNGDNPFQGKYSNDLIVLKSNEIKSSRIRYDNLLAEYNGECINEEYEKLFKLPIWEENYCS